MSDDLGDRVTQFMLLELPGQPRMMHMGTSQLVSDLMREVRELRAARQTGARWNEEFLTASLERARGPGDNHFFYEGTAREAAKAIIENMSP